MKKLFLMSIGILLPLFGQTRGIVAIKIDTQVSEEVITSHLEERVFEVAPVERLTLKNRFISYTYGHCPSQKYAKLTPDPKIENFPSTTVHLSVCTDVIDQHTSTIDGVCVYKKDFTKPSDVLTNSLPVTHAVAFLQAELDDFHKEACLCKNGSDAVLVPKNKDIDTDPKNYVRVFVCLK